jgi:hypothetical protein
VVIILNNPYEPPKSNFKKSASRRDYHHNESSVDWESLFFIIAVFGVLFVGGLICTYYI